MILRDYKSCVEQGYTAEQYADFWAEDLFNQVFESAIECFWGEHMDLDPSYEEKIELSTEAYNECIETSYEAYRCTYLRYQDNQKDPDLKEPENVFEDWEIDDAVRDLLDIILSDYNEQLEKLLEAEEKED